MSEDKFFDDLDKHLKLLNENPTEINLASYNFIFSLMYLAEAAMGKWEENK